MLSIHLAAPRPEPLRLLSRKEAARRDPAQHPPQTLIRSPIQGLQHVVCYDIDSYIPYVCVPLRRWGEYTWLPAQNRVEPARVLRFVRAS